ncbi:MAG: hypothetical protein C0626_02120 [Arcobacter sp.]|uniref:hypothetical protein n=1 Tax=uncultured Arcobacter sp. TaxID=165434 RepID=UPI000CB49E90|nr:hypothetical protein [uncultured Arcobacter sp.]PLY11388.1 MAG: hypothetical protein C0626_02120 [Arcobacter sp.]
MFGAWTTINGSNIEVLEPKGVDMSYDKMQTIEETTGYKFDTLEKATALGTDLKKEVATTGTTINDTLSDIGAGVKSGAKLLRYLPILALVGGGYYFYSKAHA